MGKFLRKIALAAVFGASAAPAHAQPEKVNPDRYAATVINAKTGEALYSRDGNQRLYPASTTKLMTAYLILEDIRDGKLAFNQVIPISRYAASKEPTKISTRHLPTGKFTTVTRRGKKQNIPIFAEQQTLFRISVSDALKTLLVHSANDGAVALAEASAGSEQAFVARMNQTAKRLGMDHTHFKTPNGLPDPAQKTTVSDMAKLAQAILRDFPDHHDLFRIKGLTFNGTWYKNHNNMLGVYPGLEIGKTGWTRNSGFNLVAAAQRIVPGTAGPDTLEVVGVVFGSPDPVSRRADMTRLLNFGFKKLQDPSATWNVESAKIKQPTSARKSSTRARSK